MRRNHKNSLHKMDILFLTGGFLLSLIYFGDFENVLVSMQTPFIFYISNLDENDKMGMERKMLCELVPILSYNASAKEPSLVIQDYVTAELLRLPDDCACILNEEQLFKELSSQTQNESEETAAKQAENMYIGETAGRELEEGELEEGEHEEGETGQEKLREERSQTDEMQTSGGKASANNQVTREDAISNQKEDEWTEAIVREAEDAKEADEEGAYVLPADEIEHLSIEKYEDLNTLLTDFYVVDKSTYIDAAELDVKKMMQADMTIKKAVNAEPEILIYHTHAKEGYLTMADESAYTVVDAGNALSDYLSDTYGYRVLHDTKQYDDVRDYAYAKAAPALEMMLKKHPSIEVVIDLHRDGVDDKVRLVTSLDGKDTAQIMLFNGLSRTKKIGEIDYLKNEHRQENLAFSFQLAKKMKEYYPGLGRKVYLKGYRYNMHYRGKSLLVELGAQTNTKEEVQRAIAPLAHCIHLVLSGSEA